MKKYIKISIIIVMGIILLIGILIFYNKEEKIEDTNISLENNINKGIFYAVKDRNNYFTVKNIIDRYLGNIKNINGDSYINENTLKISKNEAIERDQQEALKFFKNVLEKKEYNISDEDILNEAKKYVHQGDYSKPDVIYNLILNELYEFKYTDDITLFLVSANIEEKELNLLIKFDNKNNTYALFLSDYIEKNNINANMKIDNIKIDIENIEENLYNKIVLGTITDEDMAREYFSIQKNNLLYDLKQEYKILNAEYKNQKYPEYSEFEKYFLNVKDELKNSKLAKYGIEDNNNKKTYTLIDNYNNYYIIESNEGFLNYDVKLDNYTIDTETFKEKYRDLKDQEKVVLNMEKIITAINNHDYKYVYSKLADSFKNNYFNSEDSLKEFLQNNIYNKNEIKFDNFEREGNVYTYEVRILKVYEDGETVPEGKNGDFRNFNIVMQLKEGTDFVISFSIDE